MTWVYFSKKRYACIAKIDSFLKGYGILKEIMAIATSSLKKGFARAESLTHRHAKTFYLASKFLPPEKRRACYSIYAACRISDEAVDNPSSGHRRGELEKIRIMFDNVYGPAPLNDPLEQALAETITRYNIEKKYFTELLNGMEMDLSNAGYENFEALYLYCYRAAGVVGLMLGRIFGAPPSPEAERCAVDLGVAMQLTNILRDIKEDLERNRIYLPLDERRRFGVTEEQLRTNVIDENLKRLLQFQIQRARDFYRRSQQGIPLIKDHRCRLVTSLMKELYAGILDDIEHNGCDVFRRRAYVSGTKKAMIIVKALFKGGRA